MSARCGPQLIARKGVLHRNHKILASLRCQCSQCNCEATHDPSPPVLAHLPERLPPPPPQFGALSIPPNKDLPTYSLVRVSPACVHGGTRLVHSIHAIVSHNWVATLPEAVAAAVNAGLGASYGSSSDLQPALEAALSSGALPNATFDARIQRTLLTLFRVCAQLHRS